MKVQIEVNGGRLPHEMIGWLKPWPRDTPDTTLRHELETNGVVHIKNVIPRDYVLGIRKRQVTRLTSGESGIERNRFFERVAPTGVLKPGTSPVDGIFSGDDPAYFVWPKVLKNNTVCVGEFAKQDDYAHLSAAMHYEEWTNEFAGNSCESPPYVLYSTLDMPSL
jgi:phytanoyl-CoA hydroxylase